MKKLSATVKRLQQARYTAQLEHNLQFVQGQNQDLATENAELRELADFQLQVLVNTAKQHGELTRVHAESAVAFLTEKVALLERAEAAEAKLVTSSQPSSKTLKLTAAFDYKTLLEHSYITEQKWSGIPPESRLEYLATNVFGFTTYDGEMDVRFARKAIEVCDAITNKTTFDFIKDPDNYADYLLMCNLPFFAKKLNWGTSIRGAWWDFKIEFDSCGLWVGEAQLSEDLEFSQDAWACFMRAVIEFAAPEMTATA